MHVSPFSSDPNRLKRLQCHQGSKIKLYLWSSCSSSKRWSQAQHLKKVLCDLCLLWILGKSPSSRILVLS